MPRGDGWAGVCEVPSCLGSRELTLRTSATGQEEPLFSKKQADLHMCAAQEDVQGWVRPGSAVSGVDTEQSGPTASVGALRTKSSASQS